MKSSSRDTLPTISQKIRNSLYSLREARTEEGRRTIRVKSGLDRSETGGSDGARVFRHVCAREPGVIFWLLAGTVYT